jgi:hypothetical protein
MPTVAHHRSRVFTTVLVACAHIYLALIGFVGLLNYTVPTPYEILEEIAAEEYWSWVHLACAAILLASLCAPKFYPHLGPWRSELPLVALACSAGFALLTSWALFNLLWGLSAVRPVSLAGPGMALVVALGEQLLANAWTRGSHDKGR